MELCKICDQEVTEAAHFYKTHKIKQADYYQKYYPKKDLLTGELLIFKSPDQYLSTDFNSRDNLKKYLLDLPKEDVKKYCTELFSKRKQYKNLIYSPTQVELRSVISPPCHFINKHFPEGYLKFCEQLGFKNKFKYNTTPNIKINKLAEKTEILVDRREQNYLDLGIPVEFATLNYGDYQLSNFDLGGRLAIERKSLPDFIGTFGRDVERFENEVMRAAEDNAYILVVVEESLDKALKFNTLPQISKKIKVTPEFIFHSARRLLQQYNNLQFLFVPGRKESARIIKKALFSEGIFKDFDVQLAADLQQI